MMYGQELVLTILLFRYNNLLNAFDDIYDYLKQSNVYLEQSYINYKNVDEQIMRGLNF